MVLWNEKALGPDGFTFKLFKSKWEIMKNDIVNFVKHFERNCSLAVGCNSSFVTLIPKVPDPLTLGDYRPITLIGSLNKIITKLLATRVRMVIRDVVSEVQSAYIEGRNIMDGLLIMNELVSWVKHWKLKAFFFKVDFEKAFDSVNWIFLDSIMEQMNFGVKWRKLRLFIIR